MISFERHQANAPADLRSCVVSLRAMAAAERALPGRSSLLGSNMLRTHQLTANTRLFAGYSSATRSQQASEQSPSEQGMLKPGTLRRGITCADWCMDTRSLDRAAAVVRTEEEGPT